MKLPIVRTEYQLGKIGIESLLGQFDIKSSPPEMEVQSTRVQLSAPTPLPDLDIDSSRMWAALDGGNTMEFWNRIYSQMPEIALQAIGKIVEEGNRMGDLRIKLNPIPDIALEGMLEGAPDVQIFGPAAPDNVDIQFTINKPDIQVQPGTLDIRIQTRKPEINYNRGYVRIYMEKYPEVNFQVSNLDIKV